MLNQIKASASFFGCSALFSIPIVGRFKANKQVAHTQEQLYKAVGEGDLHTFLTKKVELLRLYQTSILAMTAVTVATLALALFVSIPLAIAFFVLTCHCSCVFYFENKKHLEKLHAVCLQVLSRSNPPLKTEQ